VKKEERWSWFAVCIRRETGRTDEGSSGAQRISESRRTKEKEKTIRRKSEDEEMVRKRRGGGEGGEPRRRTERR